MFPRSFWPWPILSNLTKLEGYCAKILSFSWKLAKLSRRKHLLYSFLQNLLSQFSKCWASFGPTALEWTLPCPSISWVMATQNNLSSSFVLIIWLWWLIMTLSGYLKWPFHDDRQTANESLTFNVMQQKYLVKMADNYCLIPAMYPSIPS